MPGFSAMPVNREEFLQSYERAAASATPSFSSLLHPSASVQDEEVPPTPGSAHSTSTANPQGKVVIETDSISHFFKPSLVEVRIFVLICAGIELYDEDIGSSLLKYHPVFDPARDNDPLFEYGAVDGLLPGKTAEETIVLRDVVMHWELPHINLYWERLEDGISSFAAERPKYEDLLI
ncbi:hypothetical protein B0H13DRAFT_2383291 [Mycena leptocephala]|nr:hypothetical protein B0H13DRAFT_2383291 [Mycena leptocephala]